MNATPRPWINATPRPWVWAKTRHLGTAQEEFDIATGYWKKWQRCEEEKAELVKAAKELLERLDDAGGAEFESFSEAAIDLQVAIDKMERP